MLWGWKHKKENTVDGHKQATCSCHVMKLHTTASGFRLTTLIGLYDIGIT